MILRSTARGAGSSSLTEEQRAIATLSPSAKALITAGAGTGKTHVLIARLGVLVDEFELSPGSEVLVLTFTRSAVGEIRRRLRQAGGALAHVRAATFDSFATRLLWRVDRDGAWVGQDYEGRIEAAVKALPGAEAIEYMAGIHHVLVDEIQDLVGVRAELVKGILDRDSLGFTLMGDPAQGIYGFQTRGEERRSGSSPLFGWLRERWGDELQEFSLEQNFRAQTTQARAAVPVGMRLASADPDYLSIRGALEEIVVSLPAEASIESAVEQLRRPQAGGRTAVLCRTNGQALMVSRELHRSGIPHDLQRAATDRAVASWLARAVWNVDRPSIGKSELLTRLEALGPALPLSSEDAYLLLRRVDPQGRRDALDLSAVAGRLRRGNVPDELNAQQSAEIVVSTIHRAKGLEFDRVVLLWPSFRDDAGDYIEFPEQTRLLYVALTRAKSSMLALAPPDMRGVYQRNGEDRWIRGGWKKYIIRDVEIRGGDVHDADPAGGFKIDSETPAPLQEYLWGEVEQGDEVVLRRLGPQFGVTRNFYVVEHAGRSVGVTSPEFADDLFRVLKINRSWNVNWPAQIDQLHVEGVDSVAGTEAAGVNAGLGPAGIWLRIRTSGLGAMTFEKMPGAARQTASRGKRR